MCRYHSDSVVGVGYLRMSTSTRDRSIIVKRVCNLLGLVLLLGPIHLMAGSIEVDSTAALTHALDHAAPGTRILLAGGTYRGDCRITGLRGKPGR